MSRIVGGERHLGNLEKERLVEWMWELTTFFMIEVLDYAMMGNHYHQLIKALSTLSLSDNENLERVRRFYGV